MIAPQKTKPIEREAERLDSTSESRDALLGTESTGLREELRSLVKPEHRWYWSFHLFVLLMASAYWGLSILFSRGGMRTFAETVLYRPDGDSQYWAVIQAFSEFNFGDPTDILRHGEGLVSHPIIPFIFHALACAAMGPIGYIAADVIVAWLFFAAVYLFLRMCGVGRFFSLVVGSGLTTGILQLLVGKLAAAFALCLDPFGIVFSEYVIPNLLELKIYGNRLPRPMVTEIWVVLMMAGLIRLWQSPARSSLGFGLGLGAMMGWMLQGDFYSMGILGIMFGALLVRITLGEGWKKTALLLSGATIGAATVAWIFVWQRLAEHPDVPRRLGMVDYERSNLMLLPGYASLLRAGVVLCTAGFLCFLVRRHSTAHPGLQQRSPFSKWETSLALFFSLLLAASYCAQPLQIFLLGKGAQIYHYVHAVPIFYSYAMLVLLFHIAHQVSPPELHRLCRRLAAMPGWAGAIFLMVAIGGGALFGLEKTVQRIFHKETVRGASVAYEPWGSFGDDYRPNLTKLDRGLNKFAALKEVKSFATLNLDVYALLTAFHHKRAFLPDVCMSVLSDSEIEERLCLFGKLFNLTSHEFLELLQQENVKNYFLGSNKYRFADDYRFSSNTNDYSATMFTNCLKPQFRQWGWFLAVPKNELIRITTRYIQLKSQPVDPKIYPDLIILDANEVEWGLVPSNEIYQKAATNSVFHLYLKRNTKRPQ